MDPHRELASLHRASLGWAIACCRGQRPEAEDVLQTVYVKILEGRARFDGRSSFRTWLFAVIHRTAHEGRRRRWLQAALLERWWHVDVVDPADGSESVAMTRQRNERLRAALTRLSRRQQEVLHLVFYQELTLDESALVLGLPPGTARTHYERGKTRLRALLAQEE